MTSTTNRADIAHDIVILRTQGDYAHHLVNEYFAFPCHLCGKPMASEPGECHDKCMNEEQADVEYKVPF